MCPLSRLLTTAIDGGVWSASRSGHFQGSSRFLDRKNYFILAEVELRIVQLVAYRLYRQHAAVMHFLYLFVRPEDRNLDYFDVRLEHA